ncbi:DUF2934 domain-containing protein [Caballeronia sp. LZ001]|uniref:DUF2934 domain-containing protein n=1 Tax=Caballeronia sp. LZ001 TaxID=3038553 RepID=UPI002857ED48|nr:DUF2934 domain-containing protein [Caballeronia sp. LZ001]MDR5806472.1 DUF2934 domain-containing protein [Caballeronia sp. LZ001]
MSATFTEEEVRERAYRLWEADGRCEGRDEHYWNLAIQLLEEQVPLSERMTETVAASPSTREGHIASSKQTAPGGLSGVADAGAGINSPLHLTATGDAKKAKNAKHKVAGKTAGPPAGAKKKTAI